MKKALKSALLCVLMVYICVSYAESHVDHQEERTPGLNKTNSRSFTIDYKRRTFLKDGQPFRYISGSIHYFRMPKYYWKDRLMKMYAAGLNAIQMYIPWNYHEQVPGQYLHDGEYDVIEFIKLAQEIGLLVILRPGPYICAEWEFGGLPPWLLTYNASMDLRTNDLGFMQHVYRFTERMYDYLSPWKYSNGGPIIMLQVENEYGSWSSCDQEYLKSLMIQNRQRMGPDLLLFTTDGDSAGLLKCGAVHDEMFATVDFGPTKDIDGAFRVQQEFNEGPLVNSEFYTGWLDRWGHPHSATSPQKVASALDAMLAAGANVNMYMFHGGTNFGYWNGAGGWPYNPSITSYDYDAPLSEAGDTTEKYVTIRKVISKYNKLPPVPVPPNTNKFAYGVAPVTSMGSVVSNLDKLSPGGPVVSKRPLTMEQIRHYYGFVLYRHVATKNRRNVTLNLSGVRDRGYVMVNQTVLGMVSVNGSHTVNLTINTGDYLDILVENQGRINFAGPMRGQTKGITEDVHVDGQVLENWQIYPLDLDRVAQKSDSSDLKFTSGTVFAPSLYTAKFKLPPSNMTLHPQDTFLDTRGWGKGQVYVNEYNIGRYWPTMGPQLTMYVPACYLKPWPNINTVMLLELERAAEEIRFVDKPVLNGPTRYQEPVSKRH